VPEHGGAAAELHAGVAEWFDANRFRPMLGGKTELPRWFLERKSASLKDHVDAVKEARERLWDELQGVEVCVLEWGCCEGG
jgi:hypothetical protein